MIRELIKGKVQGWTNADGIEVYYGIPYAESPVGTLRWRPPKEKQAWNGVLDATKEYPIPYQKEGYFLNDLFDEMPQSEDVLYVNIWTNGNGKKKPVYVWFHGGAFQGGYGYDATFKGISFAKQDIVFVSVEYRCGVFGFLAHPELSEESECKVSGNYGLMDQVAALHTTGKAAMMYGGNWNSGMLDAAGLPFEVKVINFPSVEGENDSNAMLGGACDIYMINSEVENPDAVIEWIKEFMKRFTKYQVEDGGCIGGWKIYDIDTTNMGPITQQQNELLTTATDMIRNWDLLMDFEKALNLYTKIEEVFVGQSDADTFGADMESIVRD